MIILMIISRRVENGAGAIAMTVLSIENALATAMQTAKDTKIMKDASLLRALFFDRNRRDDVTYLL